MPIFRSLRARILLLVAACFLPSAILFALGVLDAARVDAGRAEAEALRLARLISGQRGRPLEGIEHTLRVVGLARQVEGDHAAECAAYLRRVLADTPALQNIIKLRPDGRVACSGQPAPAGLKLADEPYFRQALMTKAFTVSGYRIGTGSGQPRVTTVLPVLDGRGQVRFLVSAGVSLDWLSRQLEGLGLPLGATVDIVDRAGVVIARHPDPQARVGHALPYLARIHALSRRPDATGQTTGEDGASHLYGSTDFGPEGMGARLIVGIPAGVAYATSERLAVMAAGSAAISFLLVLVGGWFGAHRFVLRWVDVLSDTVRRFADGDHAVRARMPKRAGELGELGAAFDAMSDQLAVQEQELRERNAALRESEARFRLLAENATDIIMLEYPDGVPDYVSPACRTMLGYEPEEMAALAPAELIHPDDCERVMAARARLEPGRRELICIHRLCRKDGRYVWVEAIFSVIARGSGAGPNILVTMRDVDQRRAVEDALTAAKEEAEAAARAKSEFLETMSHEIRTPLTAVIGMADLLAATKLDLEAGNYVRAIRGAGRQLLAIVNDILDFQRLGAGRLPLHEADFELGAMLEQVGSTLRPIAHEKDLALDMAAPPEPLPLRGDPVRLQQILVNLVGNALKFTAQGKVEVRATLTDREDGRTLLRVEVQDTGVGIAQEQLGRLFEPFTQADSSATRQFGGTGLGLAISKQLVELMGGRIGCDSRPDEGSLFWFEIPLARGEAPAVAAAEADPVQVPPLAILLAEDAPLNRQLLTDMLGRHGHRVTATENGAEFLERARERRFDLLLVDIQMPVLDGEEAVRSLRGREGPNRKTPAVALTANVMAEDRQTYVAAGFDAVLHKPMVWPDLFAELAHLTHGRGGPATEWRANRKVSGDTPPVDWPFVEAALGALPQDAAAEFLARALADARAGLEDLGNPALDARSRNRLAHRLKGTARSFGLEAIGAAAEAVERATAAGDDLEPALHRYATALNATAGQLAEGWPRPAKAVRPSDHASAHA